MSRVVRSEAPFPPWSDWHVSSKAVVIGAAILAIIWVIVGVCAVLGIATWPHPLVALAAGALITNGAWVWRYPLLKEPDPDDALGDDALARVIWETSRRDEGTISATGANIVARAILNEFDVRSRETTHTSDDGGLH